MREYLAELHVHSVLSPCGDILMTPGNILGYAKRQGIEIIAITDHNSAENIAVALQQARAYDVHIFPGMEIETKEEVHIIALFDTLEQVLLLQELIYHALPALENDEEFFGPQLLVNACDEFAERVSRLLAVSVGLSIEEVVRGIEKLGGLAYPAHVDRERNSILSQLGFIPPDIDFPALEVTNRYMQKVHSGGTNPLSAGDQLLPNGYPLLPAADVHFLPDLVGSVYLTLKKPEISELKKALGAADGRMFRWSGLAEK